MLFRSAAANKLGAYAARLTELQGAGLSVQLSQALFRYAAVGSPQHVLMCRAVSKQQAESFDTTLRRAWEGVLGLKFSDDAWVRASLPMKRGGIATGTIAPRASAAFLTATARTLPEVLRWTQYPNELALRGAATQLDGRIKAAVADLVDRGVEETELPLAEGAPIRPPKQKQLVDRVHKKAASSLMDALDETGDRKSTRLNSSHSQQSRMPSSA